MADTVTAALDAFKAAMNWESDAQLILRKYPRLKIHPKKTGHRLAMRHRKETEFALWTAAQNAGLMIESGANDVKG